MEFGWLIAGIVGGGLVGYAIFAVRLKKVGQDASQVMDQKVREGEQKAKELIVEAKNDALKIIEDARKEEHESKLRISKIEARLQQKEEQLDEKTEKIELVKNKLEEKASQIRVRKEELDQMEQKQVEELQRIASLSKDEAKEILLAKAEVEYGDYIANKLTKKEMSLKEEADKKARWIIGQAIQKYAAEVASESTATVIELPNDEIKGRIIGREGRNINTFEQKTGIDVIVDDTPGSILISGFDLMRRYIAKRSLEELIADGRIHPTRIEETIEKATREVNQMIKEFGEKAVFEVGITGLHPDLIKLIGRLRFRTSYWQNVLKHSIEVAFLAAAIAGELGANVEIAKKAGFLHDIGKAVDHEIEGSHAVIGANIARKYGLSDEVINAIESHHEDIEPSCVESIIVAASDAISSSRPGARKESLDAYIRRLRELEAAATSFSGVQKAYAIQAGREIRVIVQPEQINDLQALELAKDISKKIESDLEYPGEIKVNVVRETRAVEYAR